MRSAIALAVLSLGLAVAPAWAGNAALPVGQPVLESPTLRSLGAYWIISGDDNHNATVHLQVRKTGETAWRDAMPLFRVVHGAEQPHEQPSLLKIPENATLYAGSALQLDADTAYELQLSLDDPDGGAMKVTLPAHTSAEPIAPADLKTRHVAPGNGGGTGTAADPYRGIAEAQKHAKPGDLMLLAPGTYAGAVRITTSGEPGRPIIWRGDAGGEAIVSSKSADGTLADRAIDASGIHDVWFENLTAGDAKTAIVAHESARIVIRRCHLRDVDFGIVATKNTTDALRGFFISDNLIEGPSVWPRSKGIEDARGIQISGAGQEVCYNRIHSFGDAMDTFPSPRCEAIDFHNNDCSESTDDGCEMDYSQRNTRCFDNRFTNIYQGVSVQPVYGGPVYIFRNVLYNVGVEPFKMHNEPSGAIMMHNTIVKAGVPFVLWTNKRIQNCVYRNNLFVGTTGRYMFESDSPADGCDFDYDGFGGGPFATALKWNKTKYTTVDDVRANAPIYKHLVLVDANTAFASGVKPPESATPQVDRTTIDLRLSPKSAAVDAGQPIPGMNDGFAGAAPDLGAYEVGQPIPHYGPRDAH